MDHCRYKFDLKYEFKDKNLRYNVYTCSQNYIWSSNFFLNYKEHHSKL